MDLREYISSGILELYVLDALPAREKAEVHLMAMQHKEIADEITKIENTMEDFAMSMAKEPRPHIKTKVLAAILNESMPVTASSAETKQVETPPKPLEVVQKPTATPLTQAEPLKKVAPTITNEREEPVIRTIYTEKTSWVPYAVAASVAVLIVTNVVFLNKWMDAESRLSDMISQNSRLAQNIEQVKDTYTKTREAFSIASNISYKRVDLKGQEIAPGAGAVVYWNNATGDTYIDVKNLPTPADGKQYQLWALVDGKPIDAGVFDVVAGQQSSGLQKVKTVANAQIFAVTLEKKGGNTSPTSGIYLLAQL